MTGRTVWKFPIHVNPLAVMFTQVLRIPPGARFLHADEQHGHIALWYEVPDPAAETEQHGFQVFGTGTGPIGDHLTWVATVPMRGASLVLHVYEVTGEAKPGAT